MDIPDPQPRPEFALWLFQRGLKADDVAPVLGVSGQTVRRICLPFSDTQRRRPSDEVLERIVRLTAGEVNPLHFLPPSLRPRPLDVAPEALRLARAH